MTNTLKRKLAFYFFSFILAFMLVSIVTCVATAQEPIYSTIGPENAMMEFSTRPILDKGFKPLFQFVGFPNLIKEGEIYTVRFEDLQGIPTMVNIEPSFELDHGFFVNPVVKESLTTEPLVRDFRTPEYDSSQYVRIAEFQELKQKLHDQKEAYRRELMAAVLARFCTFMSPDKAAIEAVKYADGLIKELEK